jgi:HK97 family phage major capsid protein
MRHGLWAISEEYLGAVADILEFRAAGVELKREEVQARFGSRSIPAIPSGNAIAVIPITGVISEEYGTAPSAIGAQVDAAMANDSVGTIVLAINSPGGQVTGVPELAAKVAAAAKQKRVVAVAEGDMCSAAYWIGSSASEITATHSARVGSIGVFTMHADLSGALEQAGVDITIIKAGKYKTEGHPFAPLGDEAKAAVQSRIDEVYEDFVGAVAAGRSVKPAAVKAGYGQGRAESARNALASGMIDRIGGLGAVIGGLVGSPPTPMRADAPALPTAAQSSGFFVPVTETLGTAPEATLRLVPTLPAPQAKEQPVSEIPTVVPGATPNVPDARDDALLELADAHGKSLADVRAWKASGKSVADVRGELLAGYAAGAKPMPTVSVGADRAAEKPFASFGEQLRAIRAAGIDKNSTDARLTHINNVYGAASGGNTTVGSEGGFLVHPTFAAEILRRTYENNALLSRANVMPIGAGSDRLTIPYIKETSRATGSRLGGVQIYRRAEADTVTAKKPDLGEFTVKLEDLMGLAYLTGRAEEDAPALGPVYEQAFGDEFAFTIQDEMVSGNGVARMQGIIGAPCTVSVAKEAGQLAATLNATNIMKMWSRMWARSRANAAWFINQEIEPSLQNMQIGTGASGQLVYMPAGGLSVSPFGTIYGRPVIPIEQCSALGTVGDIILADLSQYLVVTKGGLRSDQSIHVRFLYDENAFRFMMRINGAPIWQSALTPYKGSNTLSPFVTLATRA